MIVGNFEKQPWDEQDYDIDINPYLSEIAGDTIASAVVTLPDGVGAEVSLGTGSQDVSHQAGIVKFWVIGGLHGKKYKVTLRITTAGGRKKEYEVMVNVSDD